MPDVTNCLGGATKLDCITQAAGNAIKNSVLNDLVEAVVEAYGKAVGGLGTIWVHIDTPNLTATGSEHSAISAGESAPMADNLTAVLGCVAWSGLVLAVGSLIAVGGVVGVSMGAGAGVASG